MEKFTPPLLPFLPLSLFFFLIPGSEEISRQFFGVAVDFVKASAAIFGSNYIEISVNIYVLLPCCCICKLLEEKSQRDETSVALGFNRGFIAHHHNQCPSGTIIGFIASE